MSRTGDASDFIGKLTITINAVVMMAVVRLRIKVQLR